MSMFPTSNGSTTALANLIQPKGENDKGAKDSLHSSKKKPRRSRTTREYEAEKRKYGAGR